MRAIKGFYKELLVVINMAVILMLMCTATCVRVYIGLIYTTDLFLQQKELFAVNDIHNRSRGSDCLIIRPSLPRV